jgi:hypothetical protein
MRSSRRVLMAGPLATLLVFASVWVGHTVEYIRVAGSAGLRAELFGSVHAYMVPVALVILCLGTLAAGWWYRAWCALGVRLAKAEVSIATAWRGGDVESCEPGTSSTAHTRALALWLLLAPIELAIYLLQENIESIHSGLGAPELGPITGIHAAAPIVHLSVLLLGSILVEFATRRLERRAEQVESAIRLLRLIVARRRRPELRSRTVPRLWLPAPVQLFGRQLWRRPPPPVLQAA